MCFPVEGPSYPTEVFKPSQSILLNGVTYRVAALLISKWGLCLFTTLGIASSFWPWAWILCRADTHSIRRIHQTLFVGVVELSTVLKIGHFGVLEHIIVDFPKSSIFVENSSSWLMEGPCDLLYLLKVFVSLGLPERSENPSCRILSRPMLRLHLLVFLLLRSNTVCDTVVTSYSIVYSSVLCQSCTVKLTLVPLSSM